MGCSGSCAALRALLCTTAAILTTVTVERRVMLESVHVCGCWRHGEAADGAAEDNERRTDSMRLPNRQSLSATERTLSLQTTKGFCWQCL